MTFPTEVHRKTAYAVHEASKIFRRQRPHDHITKDQLLLIGRHIWTLSYKQQDSDEGAMRSLMTIVNGGVEARDPAWLAIGGELLLPQNQLIYTASALWCHQGFPQVVMGHKYAAALLATKLSPDVLSLVKPPWRAFFIEVPHGLLLVEDNERKREVSVTGLLVAHIDHAPSGEKRWAYFTLTETQVNLWKHGASAELLLAQKVAGAYDDEPFLEEMTNLDERCNVLIGRLILNVCLAFSDPENVKAPKPDKKGARGKHNARESSEPKVRTYVLGTTPSIDCRPQVEHYLRTGRVGHHLNVQVLVAGHFKTQPHGPRNELRKIIWREPYWRGPDDAPILVKPHVLKETT